MKLLLHQILLFFVTACCILSVQAVDIPENYEQVGIRAADELTDYIANSDMAYYAFLLGMDVDVSSDISISGGHLLFTSVDGMPPSSLTFTGSDAKAFSGQQSLVFDTLSRLSFFNYETTENGGAISVNGNLTIRNISDEVDDPENADVIFSGNVVASDVCDGGAICATGDVNICENGDVAFSRNFVGSYGYHGGAIYAGGSVIISGNDDVMFRENILDDYFSIGGAICAADDVIITGNGDVTFCENSDYMGAICADDVIISGNGDVTFSGNSGAIYAVGSVVISGNDDVMFSGSSDEMYIGAICAGDDVIISGNGDVTFSGNVAELPGGAIFSTGSVTIAGNNLVIFEKNFERDNSTYRLCSISLDSDSSLDTFVLASKTGGSIIFYDSVYMDPDSGSQVQLNADYTDAEGKTQKAKGDIIFSGLYTKAHLDAILEENNEGREATEAEILNSRTSILGETALYGGRLRVEDGAIYQGQGITVHEGSEATILVKDATLSQEGYALTFNAGTTLQVEGESLIVGDVLMMAQSVLNLEGETTINGALTLGLGLQLAGNILAEVQNLQAGQSLTLVSGLESLAVQTQELMRSVEYTTVMDGYEVRASEYFSNLAGNTGLVMRYDGEAGTVSITQTMAVPEPTTATLSLLAFAALAARRRRK